MRRLRKATSCLSICVAVLTSLPLFAATLTVTNTYDSGPGSLRGAIATASPGDTINFSLAYPATITLSSTLTIATSLTISGPGASNLAISGNNAVEVFFISGGIAVNLSGVTIQNGYGNGSPGGVFNYDATVNLSNCVVSGNSGFPGGIYNILGTLTVTRCTVSGNSAPFPFDGGGIENAFGTLNLVNSTVSGNSATRGGGIINLNGSLTVTNSTISGNYTGSCGTGCGTVGGGVDNLQFATLTMTSSSVSGNYSDYGGGIHNERSTVTLINSTIFGNYTRAFGAGGAILNDTGGFPDHFALTLINSTVSGNSTHFYGSAAIHAVSTGTVTLKNSILANGSSGGNCYLSGIVTSFGHNLSDDATCALSGTGDMNATLAGLDPNGLQNNGGPTQTIALLPTSPTVSAIPISPINYCTLIDGVTPVTTDQRGVSRPQGLGCDIGAFELQGVPDTSTVLSSSANPAVLGQAVILTATAIASSGTPTGTVTFTDGTTTLGTVALSSGQATFTTSSFAVGTHAITAQYNGNGGFTPSRGSLRQQVTYGICPLYDQMKSVQSGAVFPIKLALCNASGADVSSSAIVLHATAVAILPTVVGAPQSPGNSNPDSDFRFDSALGVAGGYIFNLNTKGLASGTYNLQFTATGDPVTHSVGFGVN